MKTVEQWNRVPRKFVLSIPLEVFSIRLDRDLEQQGLISELVQLWAGILKRGFLNSLPDLYCPVILGELSICLHENISKEIFPTADSCLSTLRALVCLVGFIFRLFSLRKVLPFRKQTLVIKLTNSSMSSSDCIRNDSFISLNRLKSVFYRIIQIFTMEECNLRWFST